MLDTSRPVLDTSRPAAMLTGTRAALAVLVVSTLVALTGCYQGFRPASTVTVMTRNLYLGGDIARPVRAARGQTGQAALLALAHADQKLRQVVAQTDFGVRSRLLADEIARAKPDLVGLQEVTLWRHGPLQLDQLGQPNATEVDEDFLALLLAALDQRQQGYDVARLQPESDVEAPSFTGGLPAVSNAEDVRLTVSDAILVRQGSPVRVSGSGSSQYRQRLEVELGGVPFPFVRGYAWADVTAGGHHLRFVTTQLESQSADVASAQAKELLEGPAAQTDRATVIVCDCNSNPGDASVRPGDTVPRSAAYQRLTDGGFADQWLRLGAGSGPGFTSGLSELVNDTTTAGFDQRLDLVLARGSSPDPVQPLHGEVVGDELADRDPVTGLWPSDHAGLVLQLQIG